MSINLQIDVSLACHQDEIVEELEKAKLCVLLNHRLVRMVSQLLRTISNALVQSLREHCTSQHSRQNQNLLIVRVAFVASVILGFAVSAAAEESVLNKSLMEHLAGDPVVNVGSDGVLTQLPIEDSTLVAKGEQLYHRHCAGCHGEQLQGQADWNTPSESGMLPAPPHDASGHTWHHADDQLFEFVKYGPAIALQDSAYRSIMPAFEELLDDQEILSILVFIRSTWPEQQRVWQAGANDAQSGKQWWRESSD